MSVDKQHLRYCLLFAFQLTKNAAEAKQIICSDLSEGVASYSNSNKWFERSNCASGNLDLEDEGRPGQLQKV